MRVERERERDLFVLAQTLSGALGWISQVHWLQVSNLEEQETVDREGGAEKAEAIPGPGRRAGEDEESRHPCSPSHQSTTPGGGSSRLFKVFT